MCNKLEGRDVATLCDTMKDTCLTMLHTLNLSHNPIGDDGAEVLKDYLTQDDCALTCLTLANCHISDTGLQFLADIMRTNKTLETLNLDFNNLTDESLILLASALSANERSAIQNLGLGEQPDSRKFTTKGAKAIWKLMKLKTDLVVVGDPPFTLDVDDLPATLSTTSTSNSSFLDSTPLAAPLAALKDLKGNFFQKVVVESHLRMRKGDKEPNT